MGANFDTATEELEGLDSQSMEKYAASHFNGGRPIHFLWRIEGNDFDTPPENVFNLLKKRSLIVNLRKQPDAVHELNPKKHRGVAQAGKPGRCPRTTPRVRAQDFPPPLFI